MSTIDAVARQQVHHAPERSLRSSIRRSKLRPPAARAGVVARHQLIAQLLATDAEPLMAVAAPAGYGKTTVLAQWCAAQSRAVAWLSLDREDNDPTVLLVGIARALEHAGVVAPDTLEPLRGRSPSTAAALAALSPALESVGAVAVVLDRLDVVVNPEALDVVTELAWRLPDRSRLAVGTRAAQPLPPRLMRARRDLVEVGVDDLAMDRHEARLLFADAGVTFTDDEIDRLVDQTEGWPVGLFLAARAAQLGRHRTEEPAPFRGDDRLMADYLRAEILSPLDPSTLQFLTRTAVLDQFSGPLCDAVLARRGSQAVLESLEASNLLLVPLDRHRVWYRYHRLFQEVLAAELRRGEPDLVAVLHARAADWLETNADLESAIGHAQLAGDADHVARLVTAAAQPAYSSGRAATVEWWFEWFRTEGLIEQYPGIAVLGAVAAALRGHAAGAERWAMSAEASTVEVTLPDGSPIEAWRAYLRAMMTRAGVAQMRADARSAQQLLAPPSPFRAGALLFEGMAHVLEGDLEQADPILVHAVDVALDLGAYPVATVATAQRALTAIAARDWEEAAALAARAVDLVAAGRLDEYLEASFAYVAAARVAIQDDDRERAHDFVARAARLRPLLTYAVPATALVQRELVTLYLNLGDPSGARTVLRELRDVLRQRQQLGTLGDDAARLQDQFEARRRGSLGASSLTVAELRLIPYLPTHLSIDEISKRLFVSRNTVKSQTVSVYRKLGVRSRSEAVARAQEIGLIPS